MPAAVAGAGREVGATHVFNAVDPRFVMPIFAAPSPPGRLPRHGDVLSSRTRAPYEQAGVKLGDDQFARPTSGRPPGGWPSSASASSPASPTSSRGTPPTTSSAQIDELGTRDGANLVVRDDDGNEVFAPGFSIWTIIEECLNPPVVWESKGGSGWFTPCRRSASPRSSTSPRASARSSACTSSTRRCSSCRAGSSAERVTFKYGLGDEMITHPQAPCTARPRLAPSRSRSRGCRSRRATSSPPACPTRRRSGRDEGKTCAGCWVTGTGTDGRREHLPLPRRRQRVVTMREYGAQCVVWQTAINPVVALELLATRRLGRRRRARPRGLRRGALPRPARHPESRLRVAATGQLGRPWGMA
jgi:hypothetical protein